jgi:hypothetical protein
VWGGVAGVGVGVYGGGGGGGVRYGHACLLGVSVLCSKSEPLQQTTEAISYHCVGCKVRKVLRSHVVGVFLGSSQTFQESERGGGQLVRFMCVGVVVCLTPGT